MRILLSDGWSLAARQTATVLGRTGHDVETLGGSWLSLCRHTRYVRHVHTVPSYGRDPVGWLSKAREIRQERRIAVLMPTQEQVAVLSAFPNAIRETGTALAVPPFAALRRTQDKVSAAELLDEAGLPQPEFVIVREPEAIRDAGGFNAPVLVQQRVDGPLAMVQAVFADGELVAHHVNLRIREGAGGGASHKESIRLPAIEQHARDLGRLLRWHGALSLDCILTPRGPVYIDLNPRLVEPMNAYLSGVDLVAALRDVALGRQVRPHAPGRSGTRSHQTLLGLLGAASRTPSRGTIACEVTRAILHRGQYCASREELTPPKSDPRALIPPAIVALALLARPNAWRWFTRGATEAYALTPTAWRDIVERHDAS